MCPCHIHWRVSTFIDIAIVFGVPDVICVPAEIDVLVAIRVPVWLSSLFLLHAPLLSAYLRLLASLLYLRPRACPWCISTQLFFCTTICTHLHSHYPVQYLTNHFTLNKKAGKRSRSLALKVFIFHKSLCNSCFNTIIYYTFMLEY
jgi:hypothetical protein